MIANVTDPEKLDQRIIKDYDKGAVLTGQAAYVWRDRPPFHRAYHVPAMMHDSRLAMGMMVLKGMITSLSRFKIHIGEDGDSEQKQGVEKQVHEYLKKEITRFWRQCATECLLSMDWGFHGAEVLYRTNSEGQQVFDKLESFHALDVYPVTADSELMGIELRNSRQNDDAEAMAQGKFLGGQKAFWTVHRRHKHRWWGESRYVGAYEPWLFLHGEGGAMDVRQMYYHKHVFQGEVIYHPPGMYPGDEEHSTPVSYRDHARELVEKGRAGGVVAFPNTLIGETGERAWKLETRDSPKAGDDVREYVRDLKREEIEGIGLAEEVFQAAETGSGFSGRKMPEQATRGNLTEVVYWLINDADEQIFRPGVRRNFGCEPDYEIEPFNLVHDEQGDPEVQGMPSSQLPDRTAQQAEQATLEDGSPSVVI